MKLVYVAAPYWHPDPAVIKDRVIDTKTAVANLLRDERVAVIAPTVAGHAYEETVVDLKKALDVDYWYESGLKKLSVCDEMYITLLDGWSRSRGVRLEIDYAQEHNIPLFFLSADGYKSKVEGEL